MDAVGQFITENFGAISAVAAAVAALAAVLALFKRSGKSTNEKNVEVHGDNSGVIVRGDVAGDVVQGDKAGRDIVHGDIAGGPVIKGEHVTVHISGVGGAARADPGPTPDPNDADSSAAARVSIARLPITGEHFFGREEEIERLSDAWQDSATNIISLVAWGGVGKSSLTNRWLGEMAQQDYRGAKRVFGWSFYSQGTRVTEASADAFMDAALRWFGDDAPEAGSPWDKGERLAGLVRAQRTLLVLDGLEPLQNPPGPDEGRIRDPAVAALLRELAASNPGLCVVSTRVGIADLGDYAQSTAPVIPLDELSEDDGAALLQALGVTGPRDELRAAVREFGGHALALTLLGTYLRDVCGRDVTRRGEVSLLEQDAQQGGHARRVMESYESWLGGGPELTVLRIIGLFDRPAEAGAVAALRAPPAIPALTVALEDLGDAGWRRALARLRRAGLVAEEDPHAPGALDAHPLVREHFGAKLRRDHEDAWRTGNDRLFDYYRGPGCTADLPDTVAAMAPLFAAVSHGCAAGRHREAYDEVYRRRINRGSEFFSTRKVGAFGADLAALSGFFEVPWKKPVSTLGEADGSFMLNLAGFRLRALGRLAEAAEPFHAALEARIAQENWLSAAINASNLSQLHLTMGGIEKAVDFARQGVAHADDSDDGFQRMSKRITLANALHQAGETAEAEELFRAAEAMQNEDQPEFSLLYSVQGFLYCDLLLEQGTFDAVRERAGRTLEWVTEQQWLLDIALDHLSLGRAHLAAGDPDDAAGHLDEAVEGLRRAGQQDHLPRGLLARAALHRLRGAFDAARRDLDEALTIAGRGGMRLHEADAHMEYARLHLAEGDGEGARASLATARKIVDETGYRRRDGALAELESRLAG